MLYCFILETLYFRHEEVILVRRGGQEVERYFAWEEGRPDMSVDNDSISWI